MRLALSLSCVLTLLSCTARGHEERHPPVASALSPAQPLVIGETFTIRSAVLGEVRRINVYVPPGLTAADPAPLPALYIPDSGMAEDFLHITGLVPLSVGNGTMRPFLLVGIENSERRRDLTGPTSRAEDRALTDELRANAGSKLHWQYEAMPAETHATIYHPAALRAVRAPFRPTPGPRAAHEAAGYSMT